jgi:MerC mercury resistance protein
MNEDASHVVHRLWLDSLGTTVSLVCAIQCSLFPLLASILPLLGLGFLLGEGLERVFLITSLVLAVGSFGSGFRAHRRFYLFAFLFSASALILTGRLWVDPSYEVPLVVSGTLVLVVGHLFNRRLCRLCAACN